MQKAINISQNLFLPELQKDSNFDLDKVSSSFWKSLTKSLLDFESDQKPLYASIYSLELNNAEAIISILPNIYKSFISELAERYVLGETSLETEHLIATKNPTFQKQITFYETLENVIKKVERKRIKSELPKLYDKLTFEIPEDTIEATIKKTSREDLRKKFEQWNQEIAQNEVISLETKSLINDSKDSNKPDTKSKVIRLSFIKYAVAASLVIAASIWFFQNQNNNIDSNLPPVTLAEVSSISKSLEVLENSGLGFANDKDKVTIIENQQEARINSINKAIESYKEHIEKELYSEETKEVFTQLKNRIDTLQTELELLKKREQKYFFKAKEINVYVSTKNNTYQVIQLDSSFYLIKNKELYKLTPSKTPIPYSNVNDSIVRNKIDDLLFKKGLPTFNE